MEMQNPTHCHVKKLKLIGKNVMNYSIPRN